MIIFELFSGDSLETVKSMSPYYGVSVLEQMISTRHVWSPTLNQNYSNYAEIEMIIKEIVFQISKRIPSYRENQEKNIPSFEARKFNFAEFISFLNQGKLIFQNQISNTRKMIESQNFAQQQQKRKSIKKYPHLLRAAPKGYILKQLDLKMFVQYVNANINKINLSYNEQQVEDATEDIENGVFLDIPICYTENAELREVEYFYNAMAATNFDIRTIPVFFNDIAGIIKDVKPSKDKRIFEIQVEIEAEAEAETDINEMLIDANVREVESILKKNNVSKQKIDWIKGDFQFEINEFKRIAKKFEYDLKDLQQRYKNAKIVNLKNETWQNMQDTDSWETKTMRQVEDKSKQYKQSYKTILFELIDQQQYCPIAIRLPDKNRTIHLIAGNMRLMVYRALGIQPKIILIDG